MLPRFLRWTDHHSSLIIWVGLWPLICDWFVIDFYLTGQYTVNQTKEKGIKKSDGYAVYIPLKPTASWSMEVIYSIET